MPEVSYEALASAALLVVLAVGYQYIPKGGLEQVTGPSTSASSSKNKKKNKKKGKTAAASTAPGSFGGGKDEGTSADDTDPPSVKAESTGNAEGKGKKGKPSTSNASTPTASQTFAAATKEPGGSSEGELAPHQGQEQGRKPKTLAERLAPKPRKTKVDDMLAPEDRPATHARVMKIASQAPIEADSEKSTPRASTPQAAPATSGEPKASDSSSSGSSNGGDQKVAKYEDDYQDEDATTSASNATEEDGWDVVSRKKKPISLNTSSDPFASTNHASSSSAAAQAETKIQRKNAKKNEAKKAQREAEEADRVARLAQHRKGLERERINEIYKQSSSKKGGASGKTNGGAFASLDTNGKLVWD